MKTRSNDIIPNAPFKYESSTNTLEVGTDLYVDGSIKSQDEIVLYNDTQLTFYVDKENSDGIIISPLFGDTETVTQLSFNYTLPDDTETYTAYLNLDKTSNILTNKNVKTLFGNQTLYGTGNIDLYVHYLQIIADSKFYNGVMFSSSNTAATGTGQGLTTLFKATPDTSLDCIILSDIDHNTVGLLKWSGDIWQIQLANDNFVTVTSVTDRVETI